MHGLVGDFDLVLEGVVECVDVLIGWLVVDLMGVHLIEAAHRVIMSDVPA